MFWKNLVFKEYIKEDTGVHNFSLCLTCQYGSAQHCLPTYLVQNFILVTILYINFFLLSSCCDFSFLNGRWMIQPLSMKWISSCSLSHSWALFHSCTELIFLVTWNTVLPPLHTHSCLPVQIQYILQDLFHRPWSHSSSPTKWVFSHSTRP